ncbi:MAG: amino acid permease [Acidobacteria bacterium]|nr:amino acid permease [Acidobacteriota bacterium]
MAAGYRREVGLLSATMLIAGCMIGSGIFVVPSEIVQLGRSGSFLLLTWAFTGLLTLAGVLAFGELAAMFPEAGGPYVFLKAAYGPRVAFLFGWTTFVVIECGSIAAVASAFGYVLGTFAPWFSDARWLLPPLRIAEMHAGPFTLGPWALGLTSARAAGLLLVALLTWVNLQGIRMGARVQTLVTLAKVAALASLIALGLLLPPPSPPDPAPFAGPGPGLPLLGAFLVAQVGSLFATNGWNYLPYIGAEVRNPGRTLPLSLTLGVGLVAGLYLLANLAYLQVLGPGGIAGAPAGRVATETLRVLLGPRAGMIMAGAILVSMVGYLNGAILSSPRIYQAMAADGLFFRTAERLSAQGVPATALLIQALWTGLLALSGTYGQLLDFIIFAELFFFVLTVAGVYVLRRKSPGQARPYRTWGYPVTPALYMAGCGAIMIGLLIYKPSYTWPGIVLVLAGLPVYGWMERKNGGGRI